MSRTIEGKDALYGFPVVFIGLSIMSGGIMNAFSMLAISVICTAGVGALFWLLISFFVGVCIRALLHLSIGIGGKEDGDNSKSQISNDLQAVVNYIKAAKKQNMNTETITNNLKSKGWNEQLIEEAFKHS